MQDENKTFEDLMMLYLSGDITEDDECLLIELLNSNPDYKAKYSEMAKTRAISFIPVLEKEKESNYNFLWQKLKNAFFIKIRPNLFLYFRRVAAVILFILSTSIASYYIYNDKINNTDKLLMCETVVPLGSQAKIILPDGTVAWLNSGSKLKYNNLYGKKNRVVTLTGEGYFEVEKNKDKPFIVQTNNIEIKVLGTVFNVKSYIDDPTVEVNLIKGKVNVSSNGNSGNLLMKPNEKMIYNKMSNSIYLSNADATKSAQWTIGKLCFVDATILEITNQLERKYDVQISIESDKIKNETFSGSLDMNQPLSELLSYIDVDKKFSSIYNGRTILIKNN